MFGIQPIINVINLSAIDYIILKNTNNKNLDIDNFYIKSKNKIRNIINKL